ncbi:hypothetical protein, partial [Synechococcus lacustris]|uniref:hypothetical protein n=1 Tax=Synechococcus lacustris TaxID=2116544 RepID=UPI0034D98214
FQQNLLWGVAVNSSNSTISQLTRISSKLSGGGVSSGTWSGKLLFEFKDNPGAGQNHDAFAFAESFCQCW